MIESIDHIEGPASRVYATASITWEVVLPGYSPDSGATGEVEAFCEGWVVDGEVEDFESHDSDGREIEVPSRHYERACRALVESAAKYGR